VLLIPVLNLLNKAELQSKTVPDFEIVDPVRTDIDPLSVENCPHDFDIINLHTHGLNVSPNWPADNVFRSICPKQLKFFIYQIPSDQAAGTYFYHPHRHGAVATQVAGGMAGPLIVRDRSRGLDKLGERKGWRRENERTLMIQQLSLYAQENMSTVRFTRPDFFALKDAPIENGVLSNRPDVQKISKRLSELVEAGQSKIVRNEIETWISGEFQPTICKAVPFGAIHRLRLIHAGVEAPVDFFVRPVTPDLPPATAQVIAWDGIPLVEPYLITPDRRAILAPGNRADVLVSVPELPGADFEKTLEYVVVHRGTPGDPADPELVLAHITIDPKKPVEHAEFVSKEEAEHIFKLCAPHLKTPEPPNTEAFNLNFADSSFNPDGTFTHGTFTIDDKAFPDDSKFFRLHHSQNLAFNVIDGDTAHPLHIHVNPFLVPAAPERGKLGMPTCKFWADTFLIQPKTPVYVQMPFHHWTGEFVSHCHILDHEDAGMMNLLHVRPDVFHWPEFPIHKIMNMPTMPRDLMGRLKPTWPADTAIPVAASVPGKVSVFFFMPALADGTACPHCTASVKAVAKLRKEVKDPDSVRIVVVSATGGAKMPSIDALGLISKYDILCSDPDLYAFESIALIDGTPEIKNGVLQFPRSFVANTRTPKFPLDVMHGLFIVDPRGMVVSARRGFVGFDDTFQIVQEIEMAARSSEAILHAYQQAAAGTASPSVQRSDLRRMSFEKRLEEFKKSNK
jgi:FtsP/CotA-like multicopper oxidase with cupredoxin domain